MTQPVRIPSDVDREDTVLANLTTRQLLILALTAAVLYGLWSATRTLVPLPVFATAALPVGAGAALLALGRRDGLSLDRLMLAALRQRLAPRRQVNAPEGLLPAPAWLARTATPVEGEEAVGVDARPGAVRMPAEAITETGVVDLGEDGLAAVAVCGTINFALRTPVEQQALTGAFGRYLHSLTAPVQLLVRTERLDLSAQIRELRTHAPQLPHPALEAAAAEHADYLVQLGEQTDLLRRQVLLVLREPLHTTTSGNELDGASPLTALTPGKRRRRGEPRADEATIRAAQARLARRLTEAVELLSPTGVTVTPLEPGQATAVLTAACNPDSLLPPSPELATADQVITTAPTGDEHDPGDHRRDTTKESRPLDVKGERSAT